MHLGAAVAAADEFELSFGVEALDVEAREALGYAAHFGGAETSFAAAHDVDVCLRRGSAHEELSAAVGDFYGGGGEEQRRAGVGYEAEALVVENECEGVGHGIGLCRVGRADG